MLGGIDHDPGMSAPDGQVAGLRICHSAEFVNPCVEVGRGGVLIREAGALKEGVDQVRAVGRVMAGAQCGTNNRQALMPGQRAGPSPLVLTLLCRRGRDGQQAEQKE
ncbi:MAG: hypothetical protein WCA49_06760 [Candidatus Sulfotelmatobacter sp.]